MKIEAINKGSEAKALAFQEFLGFTLPDDYFNFLAQNDGAKFLAFYLLILLTWHTHRGHFLV